MHYFTVLIYATKPLSTKSVGESFFWEISPCKNMKHAPFRGLTLFFIYRKIRIGVNFINSWQVLGYLEEVGCNEKK